MLLNLLRRRLGIQVDLLMYSEEFGMICIRAYYLRLKIAKSEHGMRQFIYTHTKRANTSETKGIFRLLRGYIESNPNYLPEADMAIYVNKNLIARNY